jgi:hypothetical protein
VSSRTNERQEDTMFQAFDKAVLCVRYGFHQVGTIVRVIEVDGQRARVIGNEAHNAEKAFDVNVAELCPTTDARTTDVMMLLGVCEHIRDLASSLKHSPDHTRELYVKYRDTVEGYVQRLRMPSETRAAIDYAFVELLDIGYACVAFKQEGWSILDLSVHRAQSEVDRMVAAIRYTMLGNEPKALEVVDGERTAV